MGIFGSDSWPTDGKPPQRKPGNGGNGGDVSIAEHVDVSKLVDLQAGAPGAMAKDIQGSKAGTPVISCKLVAQAWFETLSTLPYRARSGMAVSGETNLS